MIVALPTRFEFKVKDHHTVAQQKEGLRIAAGLSTGCQNEIQAVIADDEEQAVKMIQAQLTERFSRHGFPMQDLHFQLRFNPVENNKFWLSLSHIGGTYSSEVKKKKKS